MTKKVASDAISLGDHNVVSSNLMVEPFIASPVIPTAMDLSSEAFMTKGIVVGADVHREIADQTNDGLFIWPRKQ